MRLAPLCWSAADGHVRLLLRMLTRVFGRLTIACSWVLCLVYAVCKTPVLRAALGPRVVQTDIQRMVVKPVILTKGTCKLAIYGIGNIKDERLHEVIMSCFSSFLLLRSVLVREHLEHLREVAMPFLYRAID